MEKVMIDENITYFSKVWYKYSHEMDVEQINFSGHYRAEFLNFSNKIFETIKF